MKTIIIYDNTGFILMTQAGTYRVPEGGIQYLEVEIPEGKRPVSVNVKTKEPVLEDLPKSETELLQEKIAQLENDLADLTFEVAMGGLE